jgi:hypothetical protein
MQLLEQLKPQTVGVTASGARNSHQAGLDLRALRAALTTSRVAWRGALFAMAVGFVLGALTDVGQSRLPWVAGSLANSGGSWVLVAFLVALRGSSVRQSISQGSACLLALDAGYYLTAAHRGIPVSSASVVFWVFAAVVVGPIVGLAAGWIRHAGPIRSGLGAGVLAGFLAGESIYALHYLGQSTSPVYWTIQLVVAGVLGLWLAWRRSQWLPSVFVSALACTLVGCAVYALELSA